DRATLLESAAEAVERDTTMIHGAALLLLDVAVATPADRLFVAALARRANSMVATVPTGDQRSLDALVSIGFDSTPTPSSPRLDVGLSRLQRFLFTREEVPQGSFDDSVQLFSAPGEGRECVEIARRVLDEAARGVR